MAAIELWGSQAGAEDLQGVTATRIFRAPLATWMSDCPKIGSEFPNYPPLRLRRRQWEPLTPSPTGTGPAGEVKVICEYSTYQFIEDAPEEEWSISGEVLEMGLGRKWVSTDRICQQALGIIFPLADWRLKLVVPEVPKVHLVLQMGKVNGYDWLGFSAGNLLFHGGESQSRFDYERQRYIYVMTLHFTYRPVPWNYQWRAGEQMRIDGVLVYKDDGQPVMVDGAAGVGGWDRMEPVLYGFGDFDPLIGRPPRYPVFPT